MTDYDQQSRDKIRKDIHSNFFVEAGAGSGKTSVLVDRMVSMVEGGIDISRICAITFTKAAAGEFYARFQKKLSESDSEAAKKALENIDLCFMGTIDSFCNMVLSEHPAKAGVPSDAAVLEDSDIDALFRREYSRIMQGEYGTELQKKAGRFRNYFYNGQDTFTVGMRRLVSTRNAEFNYVKPRAGSVDDAFADEKKRILEILRYLLLHSEAIATSNKNSVAAWDELNENIGLLEDDWEDNLSRVERTLKNLKNIRLVPEYETRMDELGPGWEHFFQIHMTRNKIGWFEINEDEDPLLVEAIKNHRFAVAMDFISDCVEPVCQVLRKEGSLTFYDYLLYLRNMLAEDAAGEGKLISHIYERHSYFLIDEFQDTDPIQAELFFYLTAEEPKPEWQECVPRPGSLFIVGDPKQSIYRFRNADVSSFLNVRRLFENPKTGEVLYLYRNFRSSDNMCRWFNEVFGSLLPEDTDIQSKFNEIPTGEKPEYKASLEGAYCYSVNSPMKVADSEDPAAVAAIIRRIMDNPDITIQDREEGSEPRRPSYSDFMVITPAKGRMSWYMRAMKDAGIPFRVEGKLLFDECPALKTISRIMTAVANMFDRKALFAADNLSGCIMKKEDFFEYVGRARVMPPAAVFSMIMEEEQVFAKAGTENAEYVYFALELLRSAETDGTVSTLKEGAEFVARLSENESGDERCIQLMRDANRVHIANLHKVKGLESPIVILADPKSKKNDPVGRVDYGQRTPQSYLFKLDMLGSTDFAEEKEKEEAVLDAEKMRLLYVAATRAANVLIISDGLTSKGEHSESNPWLPLLNFTDCNVFKVIGEVNGDASSDNGCEIENTEELYRHGSEASVMNDRTSEDKSYHICRPSTITLKGVTSSEDDYEDKAADEINAVKSREDALLKGTMAHRLMEMIISSKGRVAVGDAVQEILGDYRADIAFESELKEIGDKMMAGGYPQTNGVPDDIVSELLSADEVHCEVPFCYDDNENGIWHGVMDVVYFRDGLWHIIDYKTNADADDLDTHYQEQLDAYIKAFREMTGEEADAKTYHVGGQKND